MCQFRVLSHLNDICDEYSIDSKSCVDACVDTVSDLRNYLFGAPLYGGMDLVAINTHRARDHVTFRLFQNCLTILGNTWIQ
jgi:hypothetical protein